MECWRSFKLSNNHGACYRINFEGSYFKVDHAAMLTAQRCQTVQFDIKFIQELERKYQVTVQQKLKQSRPGQHLEPIVLLEFVPDRKLCVITHLKEYLKRTKSLKRGYSPFCASVLLITKVGH